MVEAFGDEDAAEEVGVAGSDDQVLQNGPEGDNSSLLIGHNSHDGGHVLQSLLTSRLETASSGDHLQGALWMMAKKERSEDARGRDAHPESGQGGKVWLELEAILNPLHGDALDVGLGGWLLTADKQRVVDSRDRVGIWSGGGIGELRHANLSSTGGMWRTQAYATGSGANYAASGAVGKRSLAGCGRPIIIATRRTTVGVVAGSSVAGCARNAIKGLADPRATSCQVV